MNILKEKTMNAPKFMIYGLAGIGKTTLASQLDKCLIIDIEGGANFLDVPRTEQITNLETFYSCLTEIYKSEKKEFDNIVIDSADWLVRLIVEKVANINKNNLEETLVKSNGGYGAGYQVMENHIRTRLLPMLVALNKKGYGICLIAHADRKELLGEDGYNIEQIAPKIDQRTMSVFVEWCDGVFYLKKNISGDRVLQVESDNTALAKNRMNLTGEISLVENNINDILKCKIKE